MYDNSSFKKDYQKTTYYMDYFCTFSHKLSSKQTTILNTQLHKYLKFQYQLLIYYRSAWYLVGIYDKNALACLSLINDKLKSI